MTNTHKTIRRAAGLLLAVWLAAWTVMPAYAAGNKAEGSEGQAEQARENPPMPVNPHIADLQVVAESLVEGLDEQSLKSLYEIRQIFGITRSVRVVHGDVKTAVELCAKENEALSEEITSRFNDWEKAVMKPLEEAEAKMQVMIEGQTFRPASDIRGYLALTKKAADFAESRIDKKPVTGEAQCRSLIQSMDNTEQVLVQLLSNIEDTAGFPAPETEVEAAPVPKEKEQE